MSFRGVLPKTKVMFRKIIDRADLSYWEFHTFAGVLSAGQ